MNGFWRACWLMCATAATLMALGCSSSDDDDDDDGNDGNGSTNAAINVSGGYTGQRSNTNGSALINFDFEQSGSALTGSFTDSSVGSGAVNGTVSGTNLEFVTILNAGDLIVEWTGTANGDATVLRGAWTITVGGNESGEWIAAR